MKRYINILYGVLCIVFVLTGCTEDTMQLFGNDGEFKAGEPVLFTTYVPGSTTRTTEAETAFNTKMAAYIAVKEDYEFNIEMYKQGDDTPVTGTYQPTPTTTGEGEAAVTTYPADGTLAVKDGTTPLYWPDNVNNYGFKATAGSTSIATDQSEKADFILQDLLEGYAFEPLWNTTSDSQVDNENALNFRTFKEWYEANRQTLGLAPGGVDDVTWYKKIPLYLQHKRSLITIRLKADEGVAQMTDEGVIDRSALSHANASAHIQTTIYSYVGEEKTKTPIKPLAKEIKINYDDSDFGGAASNVESMEYTCVVEPYDYKANATTEPIASINLSGQHFTFYASNDSQFTDDAHMQNYNLTPGKHLVITAKLGRGSRKILITAYVEDWDETVTQSVVDDYGQNGDPVQINSRMELYEFLSGPNNKAGTVAIIVPTSLNLEQSEGAALAWDYNTDGNEENDLDLNCTLNLAGATLFTNHQLFRTIGPSGNLVNGTVSVGNAEVVSAIAVNNYGTIEHLDVNAKDANGDNSNGKATQAGMAVNNSGNIVNCESHLPVYGISGVVGGIAAKSFYSSENGNTMPVIDGCTVNANVDGTLGVTGGGIVGQAVGRVTNNNFIYGRTLLQHQDNFKNTIHSIYTADENNASRTLRAYGNSWPTKAASNGYGVPDTDTNNSDAQYDGVIDCQEELASMFSGEYASTNNALGKHYRLSSDFSVTKENGWNYGQQTDVTNTSGNGNVFFKLDGDNHTITTDAMLFGNIQNDMKDITIKLSGDLVAVPEYESGNFKTNAIAPLAYSVCSNATISNIKVKGGDYRIQAASVGGVVVWAYGGAKVVDCQCKANIQVWVPGVISGETRIYSGGIVAMAAKATITRCVFHSTSGTLFQNMNMGQENSYTIEGTYDANANASAGIYYGGILGGTPRKVSADEDPVVTITDCYSWFSTPSKEENKSYYGAIVGYAQYADKTSSNLTNGMGTGEQSSQGNWWPTGSQPIGTGFSGMTEEQLIGRRNAVSPTEDNSY